MSSKKSSASSAASGGHKQRSLLEPWTQDKKRPFDELMKPGGSDENATLKRADAKYSNQNEKFVLPKVYFSALMRVVSLRRWRDVHYLTLVAMLTSNIVVNKQATYAAQYAPLYFARLKTMKPWLKEKAEKKWQPKKKDIPLVTTLISSLCSFQL